MLRAEKISKQFESSPVLKSVSLEIPQGEIVCLLGPSGCGKTTLLRIIAGLETMDSGEILLNGKVLNHVPAHQRDFGLMFQDFALFPHLNVEKNVAFGLQMQKLSSSAMRQRVDEVLALVGLSDFKKRPVSELSGGEQQRVALARSLAPRPRVLMLDEPLGSLDAVLRERLAIELRDILKTADMTAIYVTHDRQEAFAIADRIAVMNTGKIEQVAPPEKIYLSPESVFVALFLGLDNLLKIENLSKNGEKFIAQTALGDFMVDRSATHLLLHPAYAEIGEFSDGIPVKVVKKVFQGSQYEVTLQHPSGVLLKLAIPISTAESLDLAGMVAIHFRNNGMITL